MDPRESALARLLARIDELGAVSDTPGALTRTFLSPANLEAARRIGGWLQAAGLQVEHDVGGTVRGILPGRRPELPPLVLGSHLDTVIDAGRYDGALGVLIALAALEITGPLEMPVHVMGFSDEEGVRFHATYLGSRACTVGFDDGLLALRDARGIPLEQALAEEGWQAEASVFSYPKSRSSGYVEVHIEQGRVLEEAGEAVATVSAICGQTRVALTLSGHTDHAGTTPMPLRRDALAGAAACILATERIAREHPPLVATVGRLEVHPGASNAIPGEVHFTLDFRHSDDVARITLLEELLATFEEIAHGRRLRLARETVQDHSATPCDPALTERLLDAAEAVTGYRRHLPSGAGHDAVMMATAMPVAMLFVRCREGLSHHPDEYAAPEDIGVALEVLVKFLVSWNP